MDNKIRNTSYIKFRMENVCLRDSCSCLALCVLTFVPNKKIGSRERRYLILPS